MTPLGTGSGVCCHGEREPPEEAPRAGGRVGVLGGMECSSGHIFTSIQTVPCPSQGHFPSFWEAARPCPLGRPRAGQVGAVSVVQGVSSLAAPAPACTSLPAAVNHCSNALAGKWAEEEDLKGRATSASSQQGTRSRPQPLPRTPTLNILQWS